MKRYGILMASTVWVTVGLAPIGGCADWMGFTISAGGGCFSSADCPSELPNCVAQKCAAADEMVDGGGGEGGDSGSDGAVDSPPGASGDAESNSSNEDEFDSGRCATACFDGSCGSLAWYTPTGEAQPGPTDTSIGINANTLTGIRIDIKAPGCLVKLGAYLHVGSRTTPFLMGIYSDSKVGGYPDLLLWHPSQPSTNDEGGQNPEIDVDPPLAVDAKTYWIMTLWGVDGVAVDTAPVTVPWVTTPFDFDASWPDPFPQPPVPQSDPPNPDEFSAPMIYAVVSPN